MKERQRSEYRSAQRSRKYIKMALSELLQEKNFEDITVTHLVSVAKINRGTFYAHYNNLSEVLEEIEKDVANQIICSFLEYRDNIIEDPMPFLKAIANFLKKDFAFYKKLVNTRRGNHFIDKLKELFISAVLEDQCEKNNVGNLTTFAFLVRFYTNGLANMYEDFFKDRLNISIDQLTRLIADIISLGFDGVAVPRRD